VERFKHTRFEIEVSQVVIHKTNQPYVVVNFLDADRLAGKDRAEVNLFATETDPAAIGDDNDLVMEGIINIRQALIGTARGLIELGRTLHAQGFVRTFIVEDLDEIMKPGPLL
jgi:hypothetical protein